MFPSSSGLSPSFLPTRLFWIDEGHFRRGEGAINLLVLAQTSNLLTQSLPFPLPPFPFPFNLPELYTLDLSTASFSTHSSKAAHPLVSALKVIRFNNAISRVYTEVFGGSRQNRPDALPNWLHLRISHGSTTTPREHYGQCPQCQLCIALRGCKVCANCRKSTD